MKRILTLTSILLLSMILMIALAAAAIAPAIKSGSAIERPFVMKNEIDSKVTIAREQVDLSIQGMILPHHELAHELIESAWEEALEVEPDLIVLIGPDHPGLASYPLIWTEETESQVAFVCSTISKEWIRDGVGGVAIAADHSIETPLKFLQETGNKIPVLALTLPRGMEAEEINRFFERIQELEGDRLRSGNRLLLVGSVDFSHGLTSKESKKKDETSFQWIQDRNMEAIRSAGNVYFDSPETIEVLLSCVSGEIERMKRRDSSDFGCGKDLPGTSYQVIRISQ